MKNIAILAGGNSSEFDISVKSAGAVNIALSGRYNTYLVMIKGIDWYWEDPSGMAHAINKNNFTLPLDNKVISFDAVFIAIHGTPGENGLLQGYLELMNIPFTGCSTYTSALTFNKNATKSFLRDFSVKMADSIMMDRSSIPGPDYLVNKLGLPMFIKPNESGSSFGVTKVTTVEDIIPAIEHALTESSHILAERFIDGTEVACGVVKTQEETTVLPVTEIVSKNDFFDFEAKYDPSKADEITPGRFPDHITAAIQKASAEIAGFLGCMGLVRIDFIIENEEPVFIEVNTIPGITEESIVPKQMKEYGILPGDLYSKLLEDAISRKK
ncbi:MAG: D-alanine--D-alanine ligase [Bacteroidales bacterium]|nr:D-alanine--D-alanine ligase [Bacteroidales bacterium]